MSYTSGARSNLLILQACVIAVLSLLLVQALGAQESDGSHAAQSLITRITLIGNLRVESRTIRSLLHLRPGDVYDDEAVQRDAQALRDSGYFDAVRLKVEDDPSQPDGEIVDYFLTEKPVIRRIEYQGIKSISEADIQNAYKDNKIALSLESRFDPGTLARAATVIEGLLAARGHPSAVVKPTYERIPSNAVAISFTIDEGPSAQPSPNAR